MDKSVLLVFGWPSKWLNPNNARVGHWSNKSKAVKAARLEAYWTAKQAGLHLCPDPMARLRFAFTPPNNIRRDLHNMPAMMKAYIDGIADAMGVDDQKFDCRWPSRFQEAEKPGLVLIEVTVNNAE